MWNKVKIMWSKTNRWHRVLLLFLLAETNMLPAGQVGFQCNDPALSHPFTGDTINIKWLFGVAIFLPLILVLVVERKQERGDAGKRRGLKWFKEYMFGMLVNLTVVQLLKLLVGSPRPHFFDTCQPNEALICKGSGYVSSYTCTKAHWLTQSDRSFPSGHTSLAVHCAVFVVYYLHQRADRLSAWTRGVQLGSTVGAAACSLSRMTDHRHHWWDVLAGAVIALPILVHTIYSCSNFECPKPKERECDRNVMRDGETDSTSSAVDNGQTVTL